MDWLTLATHLPRYFHVDGRAVIKALSSFGTDQMSALEEDSAEERAAAVARR